MSEIIVACSMLENEVRLALRETGCDIPVVWMERGLHEFPTRLNIELQALLDSIDAGTILLCFGLCGNAVAGLGSSRARLIIPRFDDCVRMLTSQCPGERGEGLDCRTLFYTEGWFHSERSLDRQYMDCVARYGEKRAERVFEAMIGKYRYMQLIDTGAYDMKSAAETLREKAELLGLEPGKRPGTLRVLKKLFSHEWDDEFCMIEPGQRANALDFYRRAE